MMATRMIFGKYGAQRVSQILTSTRRTSWPISIRVVKGHGGNRSSELASVPSTTTDDSIRGKPRPFATINQEGAHSSADKLILRGLVFHGYHGVFEEEKKLGQKFIIDIDATMDLTPSGRSDSVEDTVSYAEIYTHVRSIVEGKPYNLLEAVATQICNRILKEFPRVQSVRVKVGKPHVAVEGTVDLLGVEITRNRT